MMQSRCKAIDCKSIVGESPGKTFHRFPIWNPELLDKWLKNLKRPKGWKPTSTSILCSDHFEETCFDTIGDVKHIRGDAIPTLFFKDGEPQNKLCDAEVEKPQILSVISLDNLFRSTLSKQSSETEPLRVFHEKIEEICLQKKSEEKKKIVLQLLLSMKRFAVNQQKIKIVINRSRLLRRKMLQNVMIMLLLAQQQSSIGR